LWAPCLRKCKIIDFTKYDKIDFNNHAYSYMWGLAFYSFVENTCITVSFLCVLKTTWTCHFLFKCPSGCHGPDRMVVNITVVSNHFHSVKSFFIFVRQIMWCRWNSCQCTQQKLQSICAVLTFNPQLKKILTFSVKDRYQLNYFICIKDFNAETNTSLKLNLFSVFICSCQHHQRKAICLYVYISDIRQIMGCRTPVFIQRFPWRLHITITGGTNFGCT
jgi:hypothetical protein